MERDEHKRPAPGLGLTEACSRSPCRVGTHRTTSWGRQAAPGVTARMIRGTQRARHGQDHTPGKALGSGAVTWAGGASGTAGLASTVAGWAGAPSSVPRRRAHGLGHRPVLPRGLGVF